MFKTWFRKILRRIGEATQKQLESTPRKPSVTQHINMFLYTQKTKKVTLVE